MPKTIIDLVKDKSGELMKLRTGTPENDALSAQERETLFDKAEALSALATRAITEGRFSLAWREYMLQFVDNTDPVLSARQLARLLAADDSVDDGDINRARAYLLGNAICGGASTTRGADLAFGVNAIDKGLQ